ncbi:MAG: hypothetical protein J7K22_00595 [Nanoarchaeota archaeon]|nr:hypothetical protein [Nanoarchaeota archaeon]
MEWHFPVKELEGAFKKGNYEEYKNTLSKYSRYLAKSFELCEDKEKFNTYLINMVGSDNQLDNLINFHLMAFYLKQDRILKNKKIPLKIAQEDLTKLLALKQAIEFQESSPNLVERIRNLSLGKGKIKEYFKKQFNEFANALEKGEVSLFHMFYEESEAYKKHFKISWKEFERGYEEKCVKQLEDITFEEFLQGNINDEEAIQTISWVDEFLRRDTYDNQRLIEIVENNINGLKEIEDENICGLLDVIKAFMKKGEINPKLAFSILEFITDKDISPIVRNYGSDYYEAEKLVRSIANFVNQGKIEDLVDINDSIVEEGYVYAHKEPEYMEESYVVCIDFNTSKLPEDLKKKVKEVESAKNGASLLKKMYETRLQEIESIRRQIRMDYIKQKDEKILKKIKELDEEIENYYARINYLDDAISGLRDLSFDLRKSKDL